MKLFGGRTRAAFWLGVQACNEGSASARAMAAAKLLVTFVLRGREKREGKRRGGGHVRAVVNIVPLADPLRRESLVGKVFSLWISEQHRIGKTAEGCKRPDGFCSWQAALTAA